MLKGLVPWGAPVLSYLGGLYVLGLAYVAMTPTKKDDGVVSWIESHPVLGLVAKALLASSPVQRKEKK